MKALWSRLAERLAAGAGPLGFEEGRDLILAGVSDEDARGGIMLDWMRAHQFVSPLMKSSVILHMFQVEAPAWSLQTETHRRQVYKSVRTTLNLPPIWSVTAMLYWDAGYHVRATSEDLGRAAAMAFVKAKMMQLSDPVFSVAWGGKISRPSAGIQ